MAAVEVLVKQLAKKYQREWIFGGINQELRSGHTYAVTGPNGSGKSTFLQLLAGMLLPSKGEVLYKISNSNIKAEQIYKYLSLCAPYVELIEEFTLEESIKFHQHFKPLNPQLSQPALINRIGLEKARHKPLSYFSSGMKQRIKLGLALYANTPLLLLDEPTSNLDQNGIDWYLEEIKNISSNRLILIGSNQSYEYDFCEQQIHIQDYKPRFKA